MFDNLSTEQLREELRAFTRAEQVETEPALPLPPATPPGLSAEQKDVLSTNYITYVLAKPPHTWTAREREDVRLAARAAMRTL
jgi:hypothetical protein